jgi:hypothetical protein
MPKSVFICTGQDGLQYEVMAECAESVERILERATNHYRKSMRDVSFERRLTRDEERALAARLGWGTRTSKRIRKIEDL